MDWTRNNILDCFHNGDLTYTELIPVRQDANSGATEQQQTTQVHDFLRLEPQVTDDQSRPTCSYLDPDTLADNPLEDCNDESIVEEMPPWIPDDNSNNVNEERDIVSSDERSDEEEYPDVLAESDPELEVMDNEEDNDIHDALPLPPSSNVMMSKNGLIVWSKVPISQVGRTPTRNVFRQPKSHVKNPRTIDSISSAFHLIFTARVINIIVKMTNQEGVRRQGSKWKPVDVTEMETLLGLFIHLGARKLSLLKVTKIWYGASADNVAMCTMSMKLFVELSTTLRFDDKATRTSRRDKDAFAPLRDLFDKINKNLQRSYSPSQCLTADEQLVPWRGRCRFLQYLPSKPDKYGLKLFLVCDSGTAYPLQAIPYLGKHGERKTNLGRETVKELAAPYHKTGRNITCDNFFTDVELGDHLAKKGLSIVGTVRKNKAFLPREIQSGKGIKKFESNFLFTEDKGLVAYKSNDKKHVVVLSTMHHAIDVDQEGKKKPAMIKYYNKTKGGVDTFDYMCHSFSCKRKTRRWPMVLFYNLLDTAAVATHIMYKDVFSADPKSYKDRGLFNELLAKELLLEHLQRRMKVARTNQRVKLAYEILKLEWDLAQEEPTRGVVGGVQKRKAEKGRCSRCPRKRDRKVRQICSKCNIFVCNEHCKVSTVCLICESG